MKDMHVFERDVNGRRYRIAAQSVWDPVRSRSVARQTVLGPATAAPVADLAATRTVGTQAVGDVGALIWVAEQLDLIGHIDRACGNLGAKGGPSVGELAVAVAVHVGVEIRGIERQHVGRKLEPGHRRFRNRDLRLLQLLVRDLPRHPMPGLAAEG